MASATTEAGAPAAGMDHSAHSQPLPGPRPKIAMLVYPDMVMLDLVGPATTLKIAQCDIHFVWKSMTPCMTDTGIAVTPTHTFTDCPRDIDVLFVPGGVVGTTACMNDPEVLAFLADRGATAKYITSVCTGSLVLAAAGLLQGYRSTCLWALVPLLERMGAVPSMDRVVIDRNRMSGGGVTAGLDFGLTLVALLRGEETARRVQLILQYAPEPPFNAGMPDGAGPELTAKVLKSREPMDAGAKLAAEAARNRLGIQG